MDKETDNSKEKFDKYGNCLIDLNIGDENILFLFKQYMQDKGYSLVSKQHFEILSEESDNNAEDIISSTVINELVYNLLKKNIEKLEKEDVNSNS